MTFAKIESSMWREQTVESSDSAILQYMIGQGMDETPSSLSFDGKMHRFSTDRSKPRDDAGWYSANMFSSGVRLVYFGDFRKGLSLKYISGMRSSLTESQRLEIEYEMEQKQKAAAEERQIYADKKAKEADSLWGSLPFATTENGYLTRKQILPHGVKVTEEGSLVVPLYNDHGEIRSLQFIPPEQGEKKRFLSGATVKGCFWWLGDGDASRVFLCEGFATAASINEATGCCTFMAFSASNLPAVAKILRDAGKDVTVVADNDEGGTGEQWARKCEDCHIFVIPLKGKDANDYQVETGDLKRILPDLSVVSKMILADDIINEDITIHWLVKGWMPTNSIGMVHGQSASGKTTIMLDLLLSASSGQAGWCGNRIPNPINVVYLCGEGLIGVKRRLRAWKARAGVDSLGHFAVYPLPLDLDTPAGVHEIRSQIDILGWRPDIIIIDTVNRYMSGDENSAQDTRTLLNCVDSLRSTYSCSGLYVHHTGNNEEAQKRARGSSAWRGALDFEISVTKLEDGTREVEQVKMKDSELMPKIYGTIEGEPIPDLFDDEGELVTGAVFCVTDAPESATMSTKERKQADRINEDTFTLLCAYSDSGRTDYHLSYDYLKKWLVEKNELNVKTAEKWLNEKEENRFMGRLISAGIVHKEGRDFYIRPSMEMGFINHENMRKKALGDTGDKLETS